MSEGVLDSPLPMPAPCVECRVRLVFEETFGPKTAGQLAVKCYRARLQFQENNLVTPAASDEGLGEPHGDASTTEKPCYADEGLRLTAEQGTAKPPGQASESGSTARPTLGALERLARGVIGPDDDTREAPEDTDEARAQRLRLGQRLRKARLARNLTQSELANQRFSVSFISAVERGQIRPSLGALEKLSERLRVPLEDLLRDEEDNNQAPGDQPGEENE